MEWPAGLLRARPHQGAAQYRPEIYAAPSFDAATYYAHAFGITRPDEGPGPQEIVLRFAPTQGRYALSYPLHASQRLLLRSETEIRLALTVFDTHDLRMELLRPRRGGAGPGRPAPLAARAARRG